MSLGVAIALEQDLVTSHRFAPALANGQSGAYQQGAGKILRTTVEDRNGRLRLEAIVTDLQTQSNQSVVSIEGPSSAGPLAAVNALAKRIDPDAVEFSTKNAEAWQQYTTASGTADVRQRSQLLETAIQTDRGFGLAYLVLAEMAGQSGAGSVLQEAAKHRDAFTPVDRARLDSLLARASGAPLPQLATAVTALLKLAPNDIDALTSLGSVRFLAGDAAEGERLLNRALRLSPNNPNIQAQLAEGLLESRRFSDAEKLFTAVQKNNPAVTPQLAACILLEGDVARANTVFTDYLKARSAANDPVLFLAEANWVAISKRPADAVQMLAKNNFSQSDLRSLAASQSAILQLYTKDSAGAKQSAAAAFQLAQAPVPKLFAAVAVLIADGDSDPSQWRARVNASPLQPSLKNAVLAYGSFLNGRYAEAVPEWQKVVLESGDSDLRARAMLAASVDRTGQSAEARKIRVEAFAPNLTGADQFAVVTFNEMRRLLGLKM